MELILKQNLDEILPNIIEFNFDELKAELTGFVARYEGKTFTPETAAQGKADRAALNRLSTAFDEARKRVKARCLKPYEAFEAKVRELQAEIAPVRDAIDAQLKAFEERRRADRRAVVEAEWKMRIGDLAPDVPLDRIFDQKWLNATCSEAAMMTALQGRIDGIRRDLASLADVAGSGEYLSAARHEYFRTLDLPAALAYIRARREEDEREAARKAAEEAARKAAEEAARKAAPAPEPAPAPEIIYEPDVEAAPPPATPADPELTFTLEFTGRRSALLALRDFMAARGIRYRKLRAGEEVQA